MKNSKKPLNEQKVLDKLGIDDFRHLSKEKVIEFVSLVPNMEPEVAKAAIEQFPEFSSVMKSIMIDYKQEIESALNQNDDTVKKYYNACDKILDSLDKLLDDTDLDLNEKMQIIDKMQEVQKMMDEKDSENKKFIRDVLTIAGVVIVTVAGTAISLLGGDSKLKLPNIKEWKIVKRRWRNQSPTPF